MEDIWLRIVEHMSDRISGPMKFRFVLQPLMATVLGLLAGMKDVRAGRPPYGWTFLTDRSQRAELLKDGWKSFGKIFVLAIVLDVVYQIVVARFVYPGEVLIVALLCAVVPYVIVRGVVNRIASRGQGSRGDDVRRDVS